MDWTLEHMPGPDEARELQLEQWQAYDAMYEALSNIRAANPEMDFREAAQQPAYLEKKQAYEKTVEALCEMLGPLAHCARVDTDTWSTFSDVHKSEFGFRPNSGTYTLAYVKDFLSRPPQQPLAQEV